MSIQKFLSEKLKPFRFVSSFTRSHLCCCIISPLSWAGEFFVDALACAVCACIQPLSSQLTVADAVAAAVAVAAIETCTECLGIIVHCTVYIQCSRWQNSWLFHRNNLSRFKWFALFDFHIKFQWIGKQATHTILSVSILIPFYSKYMILS